MNKTSSSTRPAPGRINDVIVQVVGHGCFDVALCGQLDRLPPPNSLQVVQLRASLGGPALAAAQAILRVGAKAPFYGTVGTDEFGVAIRAVAAARGVDVRNLVASEGHRQPLLFFPNQAAELFCTPPTQFAAFPVANTHGRLR
jgi:sugar/nucleoside kinase (ribokinase family)